MYTKLETDRFKQLAKGPNPFLLQYTGLENISGTPRRVACCIAVKTRTVRGSDYSPAIELSEQKDKLVTATGDTEKYSEKQANKV